VLERPRSPAALVGSAGRARWRARLQAARREGTRVEPRARARAAPAQVPREEREALYREWAAAARERRDEKARRRAEERAAEEAEKKATKRTHKDKKERRYRGDRAEGDAKDKDKKKSRHGSKRCAGAGCPGCARRPPVRWGSPRSLWGNRRSLSAPGSRHRSGLLGIRGPH